MQPLRNSGVDIVGTIPWGSHLGLFYDTVDDLSDMTASFLRAGLASNERCLWILPERLTSAAAVEILKSPIPLVDSDVREGRLVLVPAQDWYTKNGSFDPLKTAQSTMHGLNDALSHGYDGLRLVGSADWLQPNDVKSNFTFDRAANDALASYRVLALCTFPVNRYNPAEIVEIAASHQGSIIRKDGQWQYIENAVHTRASAALRASEDKYRLLMQNAVDSIFLVDTDGYIIEANQSAERLTGYSPAELVGMHWTRLHPPEAKERIEAVFRQGLRETGGSHHGEMPLLRKNGESVLVDLSGSFLSLGGKTIGLAVVRDVTERRRAQDRIRDSENNYRTIFEYTGTATTIIEEDGTISLANSRCEHLFGIPVSDIIGRKKWMDFVSLADLERMKEHHRQRRIDPASAPPQYEFKFVNARGETKDIFLTVGMIPGTTRSVASLTDITGRKRAEDSLKTHARVLESMAEGVVVTDTSGIIVFTNPAYDRMFGYERNGLIGCHVSALNDLSREENDRFVATIYARLLSEGACTLEVKSRKKHGTPFLTRARASTVALGGTTCIVVVQQDITASRRAGQALMESEERFRQLADNIREVFWMSDIEKRRLLYVSPSYSRVWGRSCQSLYDEYESFLETIVPEDRHILVEGFQEQSRGLATDFEYRIVRPDGSIRWIRSQAFPIHDENGKPYRVAGISEDITDSKKASIELRESWEHYRDLVENISDVLYALDADGRITYMSPALGRISHYTARDLVGRSYTELLHPPDASPVRDHLAQCLAGRAVSFEFRAVDKTGDILHIRTSCRPIMKAGKAVGISGFLTSMTEQKLAEQALFRTEAELRQVMSSISDYVWSAVVSPSGRPVMRCFSPVIERISGYPPELVINDPEGWLKIVHAEDKPRLEDAMNRMLSCASVREEVEYRIHRRDGTIGWVRDSVTSRRLEDGRLCLDGVMSDITVRKGMETALRLSEEKYRNLVEMSYHFICSCDGSGVIIFANQAVRRILDRSVDEMIGRPFTDFVLPAKAPLVRDKFGRTMATGQSVRELELRVVRNDGTTAVLSTTIMPRTDAAGRINGVTTISRDITDRKRAENALRESEERYHNLFEDSPVSLWVEDYSRVKHHIDELRASGIADFQSYFRNNPDAVLACLALVTVKDINKATVSLFHAAEKKDLFQDPGRMAADDTHEAFIQSLLQVASGGDRFETETVNRTLDGERIHVYLRWTVAPGHEQTYSKVYVSVIDLTTRKLAEDRLRTYHDQLISLTTELSLIEDRERRRIAADLHDHIGQNLALSKIKLAALQGQIASSGLERDTAEIRTLIDECIRFSRSLTYELSLPILYELGLEAALEWLSDHLQTKFGLAVTLQVTGPSDDVPEDLRLLLFKGVRELLMNVVKHARASRASVALTRTPEIIEIAVADDGIGFPAAAARFLPGASGGFGLFTLTERTKLAGGCLRIDAEPGRGTRATITMPLARTAKEDNTTVGGSR